MRDYLHVFQSSLHLRQCNGNHVLATGALDKVGAVELQGAVVYLLHERRLRITPY